MRGTVTDSANTVPFPSLTDAGCGATSASLNPGVANLVTILTSWTGEHAPPVALRYGGTSYEVLKSDVAEAVVQKLDSIREEFLGLRKDESYLKDVARRGWEAASALAVENTRAVKKALGIGKL